MCHEQVQVETDLNSENRADLESLKSVLLQTMYLKIAVSLFNN